jgi:dTDP-4-amino-4,6-dideoxygalactose transaminase
MSRSDSTEYATSTTHLDGTGIIARLEGEIASLTGFRYVLGMSSASAALHAKFITLGLGPGDEAIVPSLTAAETIAPLLHLGCSVVFVDIRPGSLTIDPGQVGRCLSSRTKAVVAVDLFGWPHNTSAIRAIADQHGLAYLADCSQAFGARIDGKNASYAADAVILSMNAQKDLAAGEGGLLLSNSAEVYEHVLRATQHPRRQARELSASQVNAFSLNARLNPIAAAVAVNKLPAVLERIAQRRRRAFRVIEFLNTTGLVDEITVPAGSEPSFPSVTAAWRAKPEPVALLAQLHDAGISARLRDLPVRALHSLAQRQFPEQVRIPYRLVHTDDQVRRRFCLEVLCS